MADKDLKSLTIGGTTFRTVYTDDKYGIVEGVVKENISAPANTEVQGNSITINEPGLYYVGIYVDFATTPATGSVIRNINLLRNAGGTITRSSPNTWNDATNFQGRHSAIYAVNITDAPTELIPVCATQRAGTITKTYIFAFKLPMYPGLEE